MFGSFYSGNIYFGKSIWGPSAPIRTNPDVDGGLVQTFIPVGSLDQASYDTGAFNRSEHVKSEFTPIDNIEVGYFINTESPRSGLERLK